MYHAPVSADQQPEGVRTEISEEEIGQAVANDQLREAHLRSAQAEARALFASYLALTSVGTAVLVSWSLFGKMPAALIVGWFALVGGANWFAWHRSQDLDELTGRTVKKRAASMPIVEAAGLAGIWALLPVYGFSVPDPLVHAVLGSAAAAMIIAGISLAAVPAAAIAWIATLTGGLCLGYLLGSTGIDGKLTLAFAGMAAIAIFGVSRLSRWSFSQLQVMAGTRTQAESVRLLLKEYEHRGIGWLWQVDAENRVVYISSRMTALLGRSTSQLIGHSLPASLGGNSVLGRALLERQPFSNLEMELRTRRGTRWISLAGDPIIDMAGQFQGFRGVGSDITEVRKTQERLTNLANMDVLSGLPNRGRVRQLLGEALSNAQATNVPCAIMFLDLDGFKPVNDTFGHPKGDAVLKAVAQRLVKEVGDFGHVGRMGGDEFAIVIRDGQSRKTIEELASRLIGSVAEPYHIDSIEIRIGVSIGCAFGPIDGQSVDDLIQKADLALYEAKAQGRGTCCYFSADMQSEAEDRLRLEQDLRNALLLKQF
ncbi:MAG: diguanylate cyclase domain-containing protein, partial [Sphingomonadales bacterium]